MKKVFYLGPEGSYSHSIAKQMFGKRDYELIAQESFGEIINHTTSITHSIGVLPIENSITSDIHENIDHLFTHDMTISQEAFLRINLHLVGLPTATREDITEVYSHERALAQCSKFIAEHNLKAHPSQSTSRGRDIILEKNNKSVAVIGSKILVEKNKLKILQENIGNDKYNMTRFVFVVKDFSDDLQSIKNKASIIFKVPHVSGSLAVLLQEIAKLKLNLTKIESRPIPGTNWEYQFWIDLENITGPLEKKILDTLFKKNTLEYKILGIYPSGKIYES